MNNENAYNAENIINIGRKGDEKTAWSSKLIGVL